MKTSITNSKSKSFLFLLALMPGLVHAALVGKVHELKGEAFQVMGGKTTVLKVGADIEEGADILVSDDAAVIVGDFFDRRHILGSGTNLTMQDRAVILKKGSVWTQSVGTKSTGSVSTTNMLIQGEQGEWVTTYDAATRRTQLTAISGEVRVASPQEPAFQYAVAAGMFTLADPKQDEGYPRSPTKLGYDSLMKTLALFPGHKSRDAGLAKLQESDAGRAVASVTVVETAPSKVTKGEIIIWKSQTANRQPASAETSGDAQSYFMKKAFKRTPKKVSNTPSAHTAPVRVIGMGSAFAPVVQQRIPASVRPAQSAKPAESHTPKSDDFLKSFDEHSQRQPKNPQEVQRLIDDLTSY